VLIRRRVEDDFVAEGFELADLVRAAALGIDAAGVEVWAEVSVTGGCRTRLQRWCSTRRTCGCAGQLRCRLLRD
jgi:hypothetical protein